MPSEVEHTPIHVKGTGVIGLIKIPRIKILGPVQASMG